MSALGQRFVEGRADPLPVRQIAQGYGRMLDRHRHFIGETQAAEPEHPVVQPHAEHHRFVGCGQRDAALEVARRSLESAQPHVLGEAGQARRGLIDARRCAMNEGAGAVAMEQHPLGDQFGDGLAQGGARNLQQFAQRPLAGQQLRLGESPRFDLAPQRLDDSAIEFAAARRRCRDRHERSPGAGSAPPTSRTAPSTASCFGLLSRASTSEGT